MICPVLAKLLWHYPWMSLKGLFHSGLESVGVLCYEWEEGTRITFNMLFLLPQESFLITSWLLFHFPFNECHAEDYLKICACMLSKRVQKIKSDCRTEIKTNSEFLWTYTIFPKTVHVVRDIFVFSNQTYTENKAAGCLGAALSSTACEKLSPAGLFPFRNIKMLGSQHAIWNYLHLVR